VKESEQKCGRRNLGGATIARAATSEAIMRFIIEARVVDEESSGKPVVLAEFGRKTGGILDGSLIGMTLQEGHELLRKAQQMFAQAYVENWLRQRSVCDWCGATYSRKDMRFVVYRTVFGRVDLPSPRWLECLCKLSGNNHAKVRSGSDA
jgi:hypothetical protein